MDGLQGSAPCSHSRLTIHPTLLVPLLVSHTCQPTTHWCCKGCSPSPQLWAFLRKFSLKNTFSGRPPSPHPLPFHSTTPAAFLSNNTSGELTRFWGGGTTGAVPSLASLPP
ncbi:hypothetical protein CLOM_g17679 [Closterium sp. NIES-68]|nr:hypothetical protein CLOM_g17679 [Closterium sp. NIES-68]